jgi:hypothetical protein
MRHMGALFLSGLLVVACGSPFIQEPPPSPASPFLYVAVPNAVFGFLVDENTGFLVPLTGSPFPSGVALVNALVADPLGRALYVLGVPPSFGNGESRVAALPIDPVRGSLSAPVVSQLPRGPHFPFGSLTIDSTGRLAYFVRHAIDPGLDPCEGRGEVWLHSLDSAGLSFTPVPGAVFSTSTRPGSLAIDPSGLFAHLPASGDDTQVYGPCPAGGVSTYSWDASTGHLGEVPGSPFIPGYGPRQIVFSSGGQAYLLSAESLDPTRTGLSTLVLDPGSGALAPGLLTPLPLSQPGVLGLSPQGRFLYLTSVDVAGNTEVSHLWAFSVGGDGGLTPVGGSPFVDPTAYGSMALDPHGRFAYFGSVDGTVITGVSLDQGTGAPTRLPGFPIAVPSSPASQFPSINLVFVQK